MHFSWSASKPIENLSELQERYAHQRGRIIMYRIVWSAIVVSSVSSRYVWVPEGGSRFGAGLKHTLLTFALGWWSLSGIFGTIGVIISNSLGGLDMTEWVVAGAGEIPAEVAQRLEQEEKRSQLAFAFTLFTILALLVYFVVVPQLAKLPG